MTDEYNEKYEGKTLKEVAAMFAEVRKKYEEADKERKIIGRERDFLAKHFIPELLEEMGLETVKISGVGRLSLRGDAYCSVAAGPDSKFKLYDWLRQNGFEDLIQETVNGSTLKAFMKEQIGEGNEVPSEDMVKFEPYTMATLTKT